VFETRLESFQKSFSNEPYLYHALFKFKDTNQAKSMGSKWGKRPDFELDDWYNKRHPLHNADVGIEFTKSDEEMIAAREQVISHTSSMMIAFDSLRETLLSMEYQEQIFGKGKKIAFGEEGFMGKVIGDFDNWLDGEKGGKKGGKKEVEMSKDMERKKKKWFWE
jgi:hypothetical protein